MKAYTLEPTQVGDGDIGVAFAEEGFIGGKKVFRKGHRLTAEDLAQARTLDAPVHVIRIEADDLHEDDAGRRLAQAVAGNGLELRGPAQSRYNLVATCKGVLKVDVAALDRINRIPGLAVFTLPDHLTVVPGRVCAGVKITPICVPGAAIGDAEAIAAGTAVVRIAPFVRRRVGVVVTEGLSSSVRERFQGMVRKKLGWFGSEVLRFEEPAAEPHAVAAALTDLVRDGAHVILLAGGNTVDPLDPALLALPEVGAEMIRFGAPAHPGSMFWMAQLGAVPLINLASCSMYSKATVADLVLPWVLSGEQVGAEQLNALGHGGLLDRGMGWRFPAYEVDTVDESAEE